MLEKFISNLLKSFRKLIPTLEKYRGTHREPERLKEYSKLGVGFEAIRICLAFELTAVAVRAD